MLALVADDLRWGIETHRLRIEEAAGKRRGIFPLEPARDVDQMREASRVAFGEAILAEALDLVEAALREIGIVAAFDHPPDHFLLQKLDISLRTEGSHRLAQLVSLLGAELRGI